jgi:hypothetical protein
VRLILSYDGTSGFIMVCDISVFIGRLKGGFVLKGGVALTLTGCGVWVVLVLPNLLWGRSWSYAHLLPLRQRLFMWNLQGGLRGGGSGGGGGWRGGIAGEGAEKEGGRVVALLRWVTVVFLGWVEVVCALST